MKKSNYYKKMILLSVLSVMWGILAAYVNMPGASAATFVLAFIAWFAAVMAPIEEKYIHEDDCKCSHCKAVNEEYANAMRENELKREELKAINKWLLEQQAQDMLDHPEDHGLI